jgi:hypothetical protein
MAGRSSPLPEPMSPLSELGARQRRPLLVLARVVPCRSSPDLPPAGATPRRALPELTHGGPFRSLPAPPHLDLAHAGPWRSTPVLALGGASPLWLPGTPEHHKVREQRGGGDLRGGRPVGAPAASSPSTSCRRCTVRKKRKKKKQKNIKEYVGPA